MNRAARIAAWTFAALCAVYAGSNLLFVWRYWWPQPFSDQRFWIDALYRDGPWAAFTIAINEHRPLVHSLLFLIDWYAFNGRQAFLEILVIATHLGAFALLFQPLVRHPAVPRPAMVAMAGFTMVCATWLLQCENLCWPLELSFTLANLGNVAACRWAAYVWSRPEPPGWRAAMATAAPPIVFAAIGTFAFGHGLAAWPALTAFSLFSRRFKAAAAFAVAGAAVVTGYVAAGVRTHPSFDPLDVANYFLVFLGRPFAPAWIFDAMFGKLTPGPSFVSYPWPWIASATGLILLAGFLASFLRRRAPGPAEAFYLSVSVIAVGAALLTAIGRARYGTGQAFQSRYVSAQLLFWFPLIALTTIHFCRRASLVWGLAIAALAAATLPANREMGSYCREHRANLDQQAFAVRMGVFDEFGWRFMVAEPSTWMRSLALLRRDGATAFGGRDVSPVGEKMPAAIVEARCEGAINKVRNIEGGSRAATGWAWDAERLRAAERILLVRPSDAMIVGLGYPGAFYFMSTGEQSEPAKWNSGFTAHSRPSTPPEPFQAWADLGGNRYCKIGPVHP